MVNVYLHGVLGEEFGEVFPLHVKSPVEAIQLLEANFSTKFTKRFVEFSYNVIRGNDLTDPDYDSEETLVLPRETDIHFVPVIEGSSGLGEILAGLSIIAVAWWAAPLIVAGSGAASMMSFGALLSQGGLIGTAALLGTSLVLGGVAQMLTPTPEVSHGNAGVASNASFIFNGATNSYGQGGNIPVVYGEIEIGTVIVSESLTSESAETTGDLHAPVGLTISATETNPPLVTVSWSEFNDSLANKTYVAQYKVANLTFQWGKPASIVEDDNATGYTSMEVSSMHSSFYTSLKQQYTGTSYSIRVRTVRSDQGTTAYSPWVYIQYVLPPELSFVSSDGGF